MFAHAVFPAQWWWGESEKKQAPFSTNVDFNWTKKEQLQTLAKALQSCRAQTLRHKVAAPGRRPSSSTPVDFACRLSKAVYKQFLKKFHLRVWEKVISAVVILGWSLLLTEKIQFEVKKINFLKKKIFKKQFFLKSTFSIDSINHFPSFKNLQF